MSKAMRKDQVYKAVAPDAKTFDSEAQAIWSEKDLAKKKEMALTTIIDQFEFPAKAEQFRKKINEATKSLTIDKLVGDIVLFAHGDRVIKTY